ncbi:hypothetical protein D3C81_1593970 [compost metagenome]
MLGQRIGAHSADDNHCSGSQGGNHNAVEQIPGGGHHRIPGHHEQLRKILQGRLADEEIRREDKQLGIGLQGMIKNIHKGEQHKYTDHTQKQHQHLLGVVHAEQLRPSSKQRFGNFQGQPHHLSPPCCRTNASLIG